jgi:hypothetical protein
LTDQDFTQLRYWFDIAVKALIGVVVSIVGMDYRAVKNSLHELEQSKYQMGMEVQILKANLVHIQAQIERVDQKLDKALEK